MTATLPKPVLNRLNATTLRSREQVETMLHDIATVLRLTKQIKQEILRDNAAADYEMILANRAKASAQLPDMD
jgi:hypothetical protein